jgi:hypothetical protein
VTKINWDKDRRKHMKTEPSRGQSKDSQRQQQLRRFVKEHDLACFACGTHSPIEWAKTGTTQVGPWAVCVACVKTGAATEAKKQLRYYDLKTLARIAKHYPPYDKYPPSVNRPSTSWKRLEAHGLLELHETTTENFYAGEKHVTTYYLAKVTPEGEAKIEDRPELLLTDQEERLLLEARDHIEAAYTYRQTVATTRLQAGGLAVLDTRKLTLTLTTDGKALADRLSLHIEELAWRREKC